MYARRGARVCLVARRADKLNDAEKECLDEVGDEEKDERVIAVVADAGNVEDMVRVRETILQSTCHHEALRIRLH